MKTAGVVQSIDGNGLVRTDMIEADSEQPVLEVLRAVLETPVCADEIAAIGSGEAGTDPDAMSWGEWSTRHPVTVLGKGALDRGRGPTTVSVVAGPDSGFTLAIDPRGTQISRLPHPDCLLIADPCLSRAPTSLELLPGGDQQHTTIGSTIIAPGTMIDPADRRLPRHDRAMSNGETVHVAPAPVDAPRPARPPQWWAFLIPIGIGIALALLTSMWWFLLFSLSAPVSGYLAHAVEKRRFARDTIACEAERAQALADALSRARQLIAARRAASGSASGLCLGFGATLGRMTISAELADHLDHVGEHAVVDDVPIGIDPRSTSLTVTGERLPVLHMLYAWLSDSRWNWVPSAEIRRLPELHGWVEPEPTGTPWQADTSGQTGTGTSGQTGTPAIAVDLSSHGATASLRLEAPAPTATVSLVLGSLAQARVTKSTAPDGPVPGRTFTASLMPPGRLLSLGRLSRGRSNREAHPRHGLREHYDDSPAAIVRHWSDSGAPPARIGRGAGGDVCLDLFRHGPHALVAGTTGSGKSMLLQTWLLAMALDHPPERLTFVLLDFKGGATFAPLEHLPHTDSILDDFDSLAAFRALVSVRAEITRRERLLAAAGCADIVELAAAPPRLVVVIDEFHALMSAHPRAADLLEHLTALGRSLGVHLILATQRPLGVVTGHMKANINVRICLRVRDEADSCDVIGVGDAAHLSPDLPGAACLDSGSSLIRFRAAVPFSDDPPCREQLRPRLRPFDPDRMQSSARQVAGIRIENILTAARARPAAAAGPKNAVVCPPLPGPETVADRLQFAPTAPKSRTQSGAESAMDSGDGSGIVTGIVDIPAVQRQFEWTFDPAYDGATILVGGSDSEITAAAEQMAVAAAPTHRLVALGRIAAVLDWAAISCGMNAGWRLHAVIEHLGQRDASARTAKSRALTAPPTLVVCDNWSELVDSVDHQTAAALDHLLAHARGLGLTFVVAGGRTTLSGTGLFRTRVVFPPSDGDGLSVGLSRQRFVGSWPRLRAVLVGPRSAAAGSDGADVQFRPYAHNPSRLPSQQDQPGADPPAVCSPRWCGLESDHDIAEVSAAGLEGLPAGVERPPAGLERPAGSVSGSLPLGCDPFGATVCWDPLTDGRVLTVRGSPQSGRTEFTLMLRRYLADHEALAQTVSIHDDAHLWEEAELLDLLDGGIRVVTVPLRFSPGYGSPLATAASLGPVLVLGRHSSQDLGSLGVHRLPPLDGDPGTGWFITERGAHPLKLFRSGGVTATVDVSTARAPSPSVGSAPPPVGHGIDQRRSAGGPVRVS